MSGARHSQRWPASLASVLAAPPMPTGADASMQGSASPQTGDDLNMLRANATSAVGFILPVHRLVSLVLVFSELCAEAAVLVLDRSKSCDRPLRLWLCSLMALQLAVAVVTACLIRRSRGQSQDGLGPHRLGLGAADSELYDGDGGGGYGSAESGAGIPLFDSVGDGGEVMEASTMRRTQMRLRYAVDSASAASLETQLRTLNGMFLIWMTLGAVWVSESSTCVNTSSNLYKLSVVLVLIYFILLFLPICLFCIAICSLPILIISYRILLPFNERGRRRLRAARPNTIRNLPGALFVPSDEEEDTTCVICLCSYEEGEMITTLPCEHRHHQKCVAQWLSYDKSCPTCRLDCDQSLPVSEGLGETEIGEAQSVSLPM